MSLLDLIQLRGEEILNVVLWTDVQKLMSLSTLIKLRGEKITKYESELKDIDNYNFKLHNQILKTLPKYEQIKIMLKYDRILLKTYVKILRKKIIQHYIINLYPEFCEYFQIEI